MKKTSDIVINGRRYDARTGQPLSHQVAPRTAPAQARVAEDTPDKRRPAPLPARQAYRPTRHVAAHKPRPAQTLMRQVVKRPEPAARRRIKAQGRLDLDGGYERSKIISHRPVRPEHLRDTRHHEVKGNKGQVISHFSPHLFTAVDFVAVDPAPSAPIIAASTVAPAQPRTPTTDEILEYAVQHASIPRSEHPPHKRRGILRRRHAPKAHAR